MYWPFVILCGNEGGPSVLCFPPQPGYLRRAGIVSPFYDQLDRPFGAAGGKRTAVPVTCMTQCRHVNGVPSGLSLRRITRAPPGQISVFLSPTQQHCSSGLTGPHRPAASPYRAHSAVSAHAVTAAAPVVRPLSNWAVPPPQGPLRRCAERVLCFSGSTESAAAPSNDPKFSAEADRFPSLLPSVAHFPSPTPPSYLLSLP